MKRVLVMTLLALRLPAASVDGQDASSSSRPPLRFYDDIKPLLAVHCYKCHEGDHAKGGLRLDVRSGAVGSGKSGKPALVPESSARSEMIRRVELQEGDEMMPPKGLRLTEKEIATLRRWIDEGAQWPDRDDYWAFQQPKLPSLPEGGASHPVDRFVDAKLEGLGIKPGSPADSRTLLRRVFFDLVGVPPTLEEARLFLEDHAPDAYGRLLDRLLADPRYGERWGRHWLDLVRYGESDGYEDDKVRPHAWRYRDYVIRSLNADKPYDRFILEQVAGDELWPEDSDAWIATGFVRLGSWDGMSKDPAQQRQDFLNDATDVLGAAFLGVTLGCARCHDHKYDVITQRDYYRVQAFFSGVKREVREVRGPLKEPVRVTQAFQVDHAELVRKRNERDELLRSAREVLEKENLNRTNKVKIEDHVVRERVDKEQPGRMNKLQEAIKTLEGRVRFHEPKVEGVFGGEGNKKTYLLHGGELARPGEEVTPGFIAAMGAGTNVMAVEGKRSALARWLASPENALTARVLVNRLWQHHFGVGLVATPSDFGRNGKRPTHPELLDWLAHALVREGWSLKSMHRLMMTSAAYQRSSSAVAEGISKDPENKYLWRMNRRRLEGESIRDAILAVSGMLHGEMGGPGVYARLPKGVNVEFPNNDKELSWGEVTEEDNRRRSIYLFQRRSLTFPLMDVFDGAPMNQSCAFRPQTTVAPQALALFNGEFAREAAVQFANRLQSEVKGDREKQVERAFQLAFTRLPNEVERAKARKFLEQQARVRSGDEGAVLADFCHVLLNANELIYPD